MGDKAIPFPNPLLIKRSASEPGYIKIFYYLTRIMVQNKSLEIYI